jgi:hypothetical protein
MAFRWRENLITDYPNCHEATHLVRDAVAFFISVPHYPWLGHLSTPLINLSRTERTMTTTVTIQRVLEPSDSEYPDLPAICEVTLLEGSISEAFQLMEAGLGTFFDVHAFNVKIVNDTSLTFCTFEMINPGKTFTWSLPYPVELLVQQAHARVFNVIERHALLARLAYRDKHLHPFAQNYKSAQTAGKGLVVFDRNGDTIEIGAMCKYRSFSTGREGTGWVCDLSTHPLRPVAVRPDDSVGYWSLGMMSSEVVLL